MSNLFDNTRNSHIDKEKTALNNISKVYRIDIVNDKSAKLIPIWNLGEDTEKVTKFLTNLGQDKIIEQITKRKYNKKSKECTKAYDGFKYFNINHVNYEINQKLKDIITDPLERTFASFIANKLFVFNKSFDYISASQLQNNLNLSKSKVISLSKELDKKRIVLSYLDDSIKGKNRRYYFLNTETYSIIVKALKIGLLPISELLNFNNQFEKDLTRIKFHLTETKNANSDLLYSNFRSKRDKAYDEFAKHLREKIEQFESNLPEILGEYSINTRLVFVKYRGGICEIHTSDIVTSESLLVKKLHKEDTFTIQKNVVVDNFDKISETDFLKEEKFNKKNLNPDTNIKPSETKDNLTNINKDVEISYKKNIPSDGVANCGQNLNNISNELLEDLVNIGFGEIKAKELIKLYGIQSVRDCLNYSLEEKEAGHIKGSITGYMIGCFKNDFKNNNDSIKEIKKQSDKFRDDIKPVLNFFKITNITNLSRELVSFISLYNENKLNINERVNNIIEKYKTTPEILKPKIAKILNIENVNEENWFNTIKAREQFKAENFNLRLKELKNLDSSSINALKDFILKNKIDDKGLFNE
ncbi:MAG: hypothetical protein U0354_20145 [Candidatus Sericytochromatia bacterium]